MKKKISIYSLSILALAFSGIVAHNYRSQEKQIFQSTPLARDHVYNWDRDFEELFIPVGDKGEINGLYFHTKSPNGVVLYLHGRGENLSHWGKYSHYFLDKGYDVLMIDYRGFGKSSPGFKEDWLLEDADAAYRYLMDRFPEEKIIVYGQSLGTAMATYAASMHTPKQLILEAPFYSMLAAASYTKPYIPHLFLNIILKYPLRTHNWIRNVTSPICIFHGTKDEIVPFCHAERLYQELRRDDKEVELVIIPEWGHKHINTHKLYHAKMTTLLPPLGKKERTPSVRNR